MACCRLWDLDTNRLTPNVRHDVVFVRRFNSHFISPPPPGSACKVSGTGIDFIFRVSFDTLAARDRLWIEFIVICPRTVVSNPPTAVSHKRYAILFSR